MVTGNLKTSVSSLNLEKITSEVEDSESSPPEYEISTYPADFTLEVLHRKWKDKDLTIPKFQRRFVWTQKQASKLMESFLLGLPVPSIFLYTDRKSETLLVIDGQQRLRSIFYYFEGQFGEETKGKKTVFRLKGLHERSRWNNMAFSELETQDPASARKLRNSVLRSFVVKQLNPENDTSIYHIFERLNTGGTLLHNQEVRNCIYEGPFNDLLSQLNENYSWRKILGKETVDTRQRDIELILRFFSLFSSFDSYEKPLKDFMSNFMKKYKNLSPTEIENFKNVFEGSVDSVFNNLGEKPFHISRGLNVAAFDSVFCAFAHNISKLPGNIRTRFQKLKAKDEFKRLCGSSTTDVENIYKRMALAKETLFD